MCINFVQTRVALRRIAHENRVSTCAQSLKKVSVAYFLIYRLNCFEYF